jgi:hypothetical protein
MRLFPRNPHTPINQRPPQLQHDATAFFSEWKGWTGKYHQQQKEGKREALILDKVNGKMENK